MKLTYCPSRFHTLRQPTREISVGALKLGGNHPIRVQSMVNSPTLDIDATVQQSLELARAGCELVRITAPNKEAAHALKAIRAKLNAQGCTVPLVADIHFLPVAAMEAIEHVEKVRVNPGNYADKKKFLQRDYTDAEYKEEIERLFEAFSPLVKRAKQLGRALRIGTNHGSLSDRIMNRYGDTPMGMVESTLEFVRICEANGFYNLCVSMKSSNPKVMIEAYRLCALKMAEEGMHYPMHLGVTEAGGGEDARIKSAAGIGALLYDGIGDTVRVSLTEDPVCEVPVCQALLKRVEALWAQAAQAKARPQAPDALDPFQYRRRESLTIGNVGASQLPRVWVRAHGADAAAIAAVQKKRKDAPAEGLILPFNKENVALWNALQGKVKTAVWEADASAKPADFSAPPQAQSTVVARHFENAAELAPWLEAAHQQAFVLAVDASPEALRGGIAAALAGHAGHVIAAVSRPSGGRHPVGTARAAAQALADAGVKAPLWLRVTPADVLADKKDADGLLLEASMQLGALLCDGLGDVVSVETAPSVERAVALGYDILQGMRLRTTKTEYISCPSCGRTLYDLQKTTAAIRAQTGHLKGVTIAIMGCIVNGPGEMADADFGYVGGAPGKINLYVKKECKEVGIPMDKAVDRLIQLIKENGQWVEPDQEV